MHRRRALGLMAASAAGAALASGLARAQLARAQWLNASVDWGEPTRVMSTTGYLTMPRIVADPAGDVHLIFTHTDEGDDATGTGMLMYARYQGGRWSAPQDVLLTPGGGPARWPSVALDRHGYLHVAWLGGVPAILRYSRAHVSEAHSAQNWTPPLTLLSSDLGSLGCDIHVAPDGALHVVTSMAERRVIYRRSNDGGESWLAPSTVANYREDNIRAGAQQIRLVADGRDRVHVVWSELLAPAGWPPVAVVYARSLDGGLSWEPPRDVDRGRFNLINVAISELEIVHLLWHGAIGATEDRRYRRSLDGGDTWDETEQLVPSLRGGLTGLSSIAFDSAGTPHAITSLDGQRPGAPVEPSAAGIGNSVGGIFHVSRDAGLWSRPRFLSRNASGERSVEQPWLAIALGNELHAVYEDDFQRVWHVRGVGPSARIAPRDVPPPLQRRTTTDQVGTAAPLPAVRPSPTAQAITSEPPSSEPAEGTSPPPLVGGVAAALALIGGVALAHLIKLRSESRRV